MSPSRWPWARTNPKPAKDRHPSSRGGDAPDRRALGRRPHQRAHGTGNLATEVERCTRFTLVGHTKTKEAPEVTRKMCALFKTLPPKARLSTTLDNGKEFAHHEDLTLGAGIDVFFAHPYHSWERGTNENTNGLIRRLYPKKSSFAGIGKAELKRIDVFLNDRPRKCLGWSTPREKMTAFLGYTP